MKRLHLILLVLLTFYAFGILIFTGCGKKDDNNPLDVSTWGIFANGSNILYVIIFDTSLIDTSYIFTNAEGGRGSAFLKWKPHQTITSGTYKLERSDFTQDSTLTFNYTETSYWDKRKIKGNTSYTYNLKYNDDEKNTYTVNTMQYVDLITPTSVIETLPDSFEIRWEAMTDVKKYTARLLKSEPKAALEDTVFIYSSGTNRIWQKTVEENVTSMWFHKSELADTTQWVKGRPYTLFVTAYGTGYTRFSTGVKVIYVKP